MLKRDYSRPGDASPGTAGLEGTLQLARLWAARVLDAMGRASNPRMLNEQLIRELELVDGQPCFSDYEKIYRDRQLIRAKRIELEQSECSTKGLFSSNLEYLAKRFHLEDADCAVLAFMSLMTRFDWFSELMRDVATSTKLGSIQGCIAVATGLSIERTRDALAHDARLTRCGLLYDFGMRSLNAAEEPCLASAIALGIWRADLQQGYLEQRYVRKPEPVDPRDIQDETLDKSLQCVTLLIQAMLDGRAPAGQILIHGKAGVGKTRFARMLGGTSGAELFEIIDNTREEQLGPGERLRCFSGAQELICKEERVFLIFDECDRELAMSTEGNWHRSSDWNKAWLNDLIETARVPGIWIANDLHGVHPSTLRRFAMVVEMPALPQQTRTAILRRKLQNLPVEESWIEAVSRAPALTPALMECAASVGRGLHAVSGGLLEDAMTETLVGHCQAAGLEFDPPGRAGRGGIDLPYSSAWLNTTPDIQTLLDGLSPSASTNGRMLLHGPPGTGKTRLAREMADRIERPLQVVAASDLLDPYLGNTEKNIRRAFDDARKQRTVLVLDEIDGLLMDRSNAVRSWEVTQVNELLTRIDSFDGLLVGTTNRLGSLDPAVLRRFDMKIGFGYLQSQQAIELMQAVIGDKEKPLALERRRLAALDQLTLGDFRTAIRRLEIQGQAVTSAALIDALAEEVNLKSGARQRPIGFTASVY